MILLSFKLWIHNYKTTAVISETLEQTLMICDKEMIAVRHVKKMNDMIFDEEMIA